MKGTNTLKVNAATLCEMAQEYFDKRSVESIGDVDSVTVRDVGMCPSFEFSIKELGDEG